MTQKNAQEEPPLGRIVTFFSYKGGTGRSMALANVAWILASAGHSVLMIDWDLEAPGLHRYFHPFLADPELLESVGLIDFFIEFAAAAVAPSAEHNTQWFEPYANILDYAHSVDFQFETIGQCCGHLDFIPAGKQDQAYSVRVNGFNWDRFYTAFGGGVFLEAVKQRLRDEYDYILIDSRTGVSDTAGICTVQMPDDLVSCFTLNRQSILGCAAVARSALLQRNPTSSRANLRIWPVPTRVEDAEKRSRDRMLEYATRTFNDMLEHISQGERDQYWGAVCVPYQPFYAYDEVLSVFGDRPHASGSMLSSMEALTRYLARGSISTFRSMDEQTRQNGLRKFAGVMSQESDFRPSEGYGNSELEPTKLCYVSYSAQDARSDIDTDDPLQRVINDLSHEVRVLSGDVSFSFFLNRMSVNPSANLETTLKSALMDAKVLLALISPNYVRSEWCNYELDEFQSKGGLVLPVPWVPVAISNLPAGIRGIQFTRDGFPEAYATEGLRHLQRLSRARSDYYEAIFELAKRLVRAISSTESRAVRLHEDATRKRVRELAIAYSKIRGEMPSGEDRTVLLEEIAAEMRGLAGEGRKFLPELTASEHPGERLAAATFLQVTPYRRYLKWLADRLSPDVETPFIGYHAAVALRAAARNLGKQELAEVDQCIRQALKSMARLPGSDRNRTLELALTDLNERTR